MDQSLPVLEGQLRENFGRVVYSHKTHEKCADILLARQANIKIAQIVLSAITTGSFLATVLGFFGYEKVATGVGAVCSAVLLILNAYTKDNDLGQLAQKHRQAATDIWLIREQYLSLITDLVAGTRSAQQIMNERDRLVTALHAAYAGAPSTNGPAYQRAQAALQHNEEMTFSDAEIDAFLPARLHGSR